MCGFTSAFNRARAGFSPGRVDALVWALTDLVLQPMACWGIYEATRLKSLGLRVGKSKAAEVTRPFEKPYYAPGSVEWQEQQQQKAGA
jgi:hypothetical protein